jgi:hypothetical protein
MSCRLATTCRRLVLVSASTVLLTGCAAEAPTTPSALGAARGSGVMGQQSGAHQPLELGFEKTGGDQAGPVLTWTGSVTREGQPFGAMTTTTDASTWVPHGSSSKAFNVRFEFVVTRDASVLVLDLGGLLNLPAPSSNGPGLVNLNGVVREASGEFAPLAGARVHEQGRLIGITNGATSWEGVIRVLAGSARE